MGGGTLLCLKVVCRGGSRIFRGGGMVKETKLQDGRLERLPPGSATGKELPCN